MDKKIVVGIAVAVLLVVAGGTFFYLRETSPQEEYTTTPTQWSQAGDYKIQQIPDPENSTIVRTMVLNEKAGFSFMVPEGWRVEKNEVDDEFWLSLLSPDAQFDENGVFTGGCGINVETVNHPIEVNAVRASIASGLFKNQRIIEVDGFTAVQTFNTPTDKALEEKIGTTIKVDLPLNDDYLVTIITQVFPTHSEECTRIFEGFLEKLSS